MLLILLALLLTFGWGIMRGPAERRLAASLGQPVRIGSLRRVDLFSLHPLLEIGDLRVAQPGWAGPGDMARVRVARVRLPVLPLVAGKVEPELVSVDGLRLALVRDRNGRVNWRRDGAPRSDGASPRLGRMMLSDARITLNDAMRDRRLTLRAAISPAGLRITGDGSIGGAAATVRVTGAPVARQGAWPFHIQIRSRIVSLDFFGHAAAPLDIGHFRGRLAASGHDLRDLDRIIEAGLPATQEFAGVAQVEHDPSVWVISGIKGRAGRSEISADFTLHKYGGRTLFDGDLVSDGLDFDDLTSDEGLAMAAADLRANGVRFFTTTSIRLATLRQIDGVLRVDFRRLLFKRPSAMRSLSGTLTLDHGVLTAAPVVATLADGKVTGTAIVRHQAGVPLLSIDARLTGGRLETTVTTPGIATGSLVGRFRLEGRGNTIREAIGRSSGVMGFFARDGTVNRRVALFAGADLGRVATTGAGERTPLRCAAARYAVARGIAVPELLEIDTGVARDIGSGQVDLATERLDIALKGRAKLAGGLRFDAPVRVLGTIKLPRIVPPPHLGSAGNVLKMIGKALGGGEALVGDADCAALAESALR